MITFLVFCFFDVFVHVRIPSALQRLNGSVSELLALEDNVSVPTAFGYENANGTQISTHVVHKLTTQLFVQGQITLGV